MIDKNDPEIQVYLQEELQKQKEQIAERILWRNAKSLIGGPTYADMEYYTGLSRAEIEEIADKCQWKLRIKECYGEGNLIGRVESLCNCLKNKDIDCEKISGGYGIDLSCVKEWAKDPKKHAVLELVSQGIDDDYIIESFNLTEEEFLNLVPSDQELWEYKPVFQRKELSDEELELRYQKMIESEDSDGKTDW